jgi:hypothetical protein
MIMEAWLLGPAVIFTFVGMSFRKSSREIISFAVEQTVDKLIADGYIRTRKDENGEIHLLKHYEE